MFNDVHMWRGLDSTSMQEHEYKVLQKELSLRPKKCLLWFVEASYSVIQLEGCKPWMLSSYPNLDILGDLFLFARPRCCCGAGRCEPIVPEAVVLPIRLGDGTKLSLERMEFDSIPKDEDISKLIGDVYSMHILTYATYIQRSFDLDGSKFNELMDACVAKSFQFESSLNFFCSSSLPAPYLFEGFPYIQTVNFKLTGEGLPRGFHRPSHGGGISRSASSSRMRHKPVKEMAYPGTLKRTAVRTWKWGAPWKLGDSYWKSSFLIFRCELLVLGSKVFYLHSVGFYL